MAETTPGGTVSYVRDPLDRLVRRTDKGVVTQFAYRGLGDVPVAVYDGARNLVQQFVYLPGGVSVTLDAAATSGTWSFPNLHGHVTATSNDNGDRLTSVVYDPWGVALNPAPNNVSGTADLGAYGGSGKLTESTTTKAVTHMGARPYTASTARFLTVDPIHGGCANHYVYGFGDPINAQDLTGKRTGNLCSEMWDIDWSDLAIGPSTILTIGSVAAMGAAALYLDVKDCLQSGGVACVQAGLGLVLPRSSVAAGVSIAIDVLDGGGQGATSPLAGNQSVWLRQQYWMDCWAAGLPYPGWKRHGQYE